MTPVYIGVDSGAADTVCPKEFAPQCEVVETSASKNGKYYLAANDSRIAIYGRTHLKGLTDDWNNFELKAEVADVKRPLVSVSKMCEAGNRVVFDPAGSYVENIMTGKGQQWSTQEKGTGSRSGCLLFRGRYTRKTRRDRERREREDSGIWR